VRLLYLSDIRFPLERANGIQTMETCHALARRGHDVTLVVRPDTAKPARDPFAFYSLPRLERLHVVTVRVHGGPTTRRASYLTQAVRHMAFREADVTFTRDLGLAAFALHLPARLRRPLIYESHGLSAQVSGDLGTLLSTANSASPRKQKRLLAREHAVWRKADGYVTITAALAEDLRARFGPRGALAVVPDGVRLRDDRQFVPPSTTAAPLAVYAGHLYPWKGVDTLLQALPLAPRLRARIVGGHPLEPDLPRLKALAVTLGVASRMEFTGLVLPEEVAAHLARADVLVLPNTATTLSARYTSPLKLFEYLAAGRPVVASDLPALREILEHGTNAWLVPPGDAVALAQAMDDVTSNRALGCRLAQAAYDLAPSFTWDARAARLEALCDAVQTTSLQHPAPG
jgi:glycosyltransferase involved in cell wall biosynthesis